MRRSWISYLLFFVMTAGAAWAAPQVGLPWAPQAAGVQVRSALHDAILFGDTLVERRSGRDLSGSVRMFRFADKTTGTARSISVYVASHSRARTLAVGLYTDKRGHPGSLLASGSLSAPQTRKWNNVTIKPAKFVEKVQADQKHYQLLCANCNWIKKHEQNETVGTRVYERAVPTERIKGVGKGNGPGQRAALARSRTSEAQAARARKKKGKPNPKVAEARRGTKLVDGHWVRPE
jgi:hypothetical protein